MRLMLAISCFLALLACGSAASADETVDRRLFGCWEKYTPGNGQPADVNFVTMCIADDGVIYGATVDDGDGWDWMNGYEVDGNVLRFQNDSEEVLRNECRFVVKAGDHLTLIDCDMSGYYRNSCKVGHVGIEGAVRSYHCDD